jgi:hypothetical protein
LVQVRQSCCPGAASRRNRNDHIRMHGIHPSLPHPKAGACHHCRRCATAGRLDWEARMTTWHKGPPPSIGWWPASRLRNPDVLRWWDGSKWSFPAHIGMTAEEAAGHSALKSDRTLHLEWTDRPASWPERSRT